MQVQASFCKICCHCFVKHAVIVLWAVCIIDFLKHAVIVLWAACIIVLLNMLSLYCEQCVLLYCETCCHCIVNSVYYCFVKHAVIVLWTVCIIVLFTMLSLYCERCVLLFCGTCCHCIVNSGYYCFVKHAVIVLWTVCIIVFETCCHCIVNSVHYCFVKPACVLCINSIIVFNSRMSLCWTARCPCFVLVHYNVIVLYKSSLLLHTYMYIVSTIHGNMVLRPCMYLYSKTTTTFTFEWLSAFVILSKVPQSIIEVVS